MRKVMTSFSAKITDKRQIQKDNWDSISFLYFNFQFYFIFRWWRWKSTEKSEKKLEVSRFNLNWWKYFYKFIEFAYGFLIAFDSKNNFHFIWIIEKMSWFFVDLHFEWWVWRKLLGTWISEFLILDVRGSNPTWIMQLCAIHLGMFSFFLTFFKKFSKWKWFIDFNNIFEIYGVFGRVETSKDFSIMIFRVAFLNVSINTII